GGNVIGYCGFDALDVRQAVRSHAQKLFQVLRRPTRLGEEAKKALQLYDLEYRKLQVYRMLFELRFGRDGIRADHRRTMALFSDRLRNALELAGPTHLG